MFRRYTLVATTILMLFSGSALHAEQDQTKGQRESILLVAARHMGDFNFARTVVLVMFPTDTGPSGVILNRPTPMMLRDIWPEREDRQGRTDTLYFGGPVQPDGLLFLFRRAPAPERAWWAVDDIYFSGDGDLLNELLHQPEPDPSQRFFAGYAGWAAGQLEREIARGDWHVLKALPDIIYDTDHETLWQRMYQRATLPRADGGTLPVSHNGESSSIRAPNALSVGLVQSHQ